MEEKAAWLKIKCKALFKNWFSHFYYRIWNGCFSFGAKCVVIQSATTSPILRSHALAHQRGPRGRASNNRLALPIGLPSRKCWDPPLSVINFLYVASAVHALWFKGWSCFCKPDLWHQTSLYAFHAPLRHIQQWTWSEQNHKYFRFEYWG